jgi:SAM-dependent methyltransferase
MDDARKILRTLYRKRSGFEIPDSEEAVVDRAESSPMYGELMPAAAARLLAHLRLERTDAFYDLGSGVGKLVLHAAMVSRAKCVGVELVAPRWAMATAALDEAKELGVIRAREVRFFNEDFSETDLSDATVVYTCSTAFPIRFMHRLCHRLAALRRGLVFVTLQDLDPNPWFQPEQVLFLDVSWKRRTRVHIYRLVSRRHL